VSAQDPGSDRTATLRRNERWKRCCSLHAGPKAAVELERSSGRTLDATERVSRLLALFEGEPRPRVLPGPVPAAGRVVSASRDRAAAARHAPSGGHHRVPGPVRRTRPRSRGSRRCPHRQRIGSDRRCGALAWARQGRIGLVAQRFRNTGSGCLTSSSRLCLPHPTRAHPSPGHTDCWRHGALGFGRAVAFEAPEKREGKRRGRQDQPPVRAGLTALCRNVKGEVQCGS
jgi:hypothetical protein